MLYEPPVKDSRERKKSDRITNVKSIILFHLEITTSIYVMKKAFEIKTDLFSDTVVSVVHSNQEIDANLTLFWDEYFRIDKLSFKKFGNFNCCDSVEIKHLISSISDYFVKQTSRGLTHPNQSFLLTKLGKSFSCITFHSFARNHMVNSDYSFGHWICNIIKLLKLEGIIGMWKNDLIDGFVSKDSEPLLGASSGSFYLRFSERNPKIGVVIKVGQKVDAWSPFSIDECRSRKLPERLMDYQELRSLKTAFGVFLDKIECLSQYIDRVIPDDGYTQRGRLTKFLNGDIYTDECDGYINDMELEEIYPDENINLNLFLETGN